MTRRRKILIISASAAAGLLAVQTLTYALFAGRAERGLPWAGIRSLGGELLDWADFVVIEPETWSGLTDAQRSDLSTELARHVDTIYLSLADVPDDAVEWVPVTEEDRADYERWKEPGRVSPAILEKKRREIEAGRRMVGFKKGAMLRWSIEGRGPFWIKTGSGDWVSIFGGTGRADIYVWALFRWVRVWHLWTMVI